MRFSSNTTKLEKPIATDWWEVQKLHFGRWPFIQMVPLITFQIFVQVGPLPDNPGLPVTPTSDSCTCMLGLLRTLMTKSARLMERISVPPLFPGGNATYNGSMLLKTDIIDLNLTVYFTIHRHYLFRRYQSTWQLSILLMCHFLTPKYYLKQDNNTSFLFDVGFRLWFMARFESNLLFVDRGSLSSF